jgi:hypothetical protein
MRARHFSFSILPRKKHRNATRPSQLKEHRTLKSFCCGAKKRSDLARHASSARGSVLSAARGTIVSTFRGKATNTASRDSREHSIPGFRPLGYRERQRVFKISLITSWSKHKFHLQINTASMFSKANAVSSCSLPESHS